MTSERTLRHPNGGALKIGLEVHVSPDSFCDYQSVIKGRSGVFSSTLLNGLVDTGQVFRSTLDRSVAINSTVAECSCLRFYGKDVILHNVDVLADDQGIVLKEVVAENCKLYGSWTLDGNARIPTGVWYRPPRFKRITGEGVDFGLTESTDGHAMLGCFRKPLRELLHAGPRLGNKRGWTEEQIRAAKEFYEELADVRMEGVRT